VGLPIAVNLVIAMIAKQWEVPQIAIKLSKAGLRPPGREIIQDVGVVMPHSSAANEIMQAIYGKDKSNIAEITGGAVYQDLIEMKKDGCACICHHRFYQCRFCLQDQYTLLTSYFLSYLMLFERMNKEKTHDSHFFHLAGSDFYVLTGRGFSYTASTDK
jgi:hypothetical protein